VCICPHENGWGATIYGGPEAKKSDRGIVAKHFALNIDEAKSWVITDLGQRTSGENDSLELVWEHLDCNPPRT
jgi:hypothetical protein